MRLDEQNVKNNSKIMVLNVSSEEVKSEMREEEEKKRSQDEGVQRTQKGFQILSERGEHDTKSKHLCLHQIVRAWISQCSIQNKNIKYYIKILNHFNNNNSQ